MFTHVIFVLKLKTELLFVSLYFQQRIGSLGWRKATPLWVKTILPAFFFEIEEYSPFFIKQSELQWRAGLVQLVSASSLSHQVLGSKPSLCRISAGVRLCFGYSLPQTPLVWEPLALSLLFRVKYNPSCFVALHITRCISHPLPCCESFVQQGLVPKRDLLLSNCSSVCALLSETQPASFVLSFILLLLTSLAVSWMHSIVGGPF
jgi:hypothetical protein